MNKTILITEVSKDYELLDSGEGEKLERFGGFTLSRPDPQALWRKRLDAREWEKADGVFTRDEKKGEWRLAKTVPERWQIGLGGLKMWVKPTVFKHTGIFPEQSANWEWLRGTLNAVPAPSPTLSLRVPRRTPLVGHAPRSVGDGAADAMTETDTFVATGGESSAPVATPEVLNLFGYTGGATLACVSAGAKVTHVDGSKAAMTWARENAELSGLGDRPVRWILDDARTFVKREIKRGRKYDGIIMDPPSFGHGPEGELWKIEEDLLPLVESCAALLSDDIDSKHHDLPHFFLINGYSAGYSALAYENILLSLKEKFGGETKFGELAIRESKMADLESRILPCGIFARWMAE